MPERIAREKIVFFPITNEGRKVDRPNLVHVHDSGFFVAQAYLMHSLKLAFKYKLCEPFNNVT